MSYSNKTAQEIVAARLATLRNKNPEATAQDATFFMVDVFDCSLKGDLASMEHPLFALKAGDTRTRHYEHNGNTVTVLPNVVGCATIHDKDIWIYCISALVAAQNQGLPVHRTLRFTAYDFLKTTNRRTSGHSYKLLREAFDRLAGTRIVTNIQTGGRRERDNFGLLERVRFILANLDDENSPMVAVEVTLPDWVFRSVQAKQIKTLSADYFHIRKPLDRRIYELCAKHCGNQATWTISLEMLHKKSGSTATLREFRRYIKQLANKSYLLEYGICYCENNDTIKISNKSKCLNRFRLLKTHKS